MDHRPGPDLQVAARPATSVKHHPLQRTAAPRRHTAARRAGRGRRMDPSSCRRTVPVPSVHGLPADSALPRRRAPDRPKFATGSFTIANRPSAQNDASWPCATPSAGSLRPGTGLATSSGCPQARTAADTALADTCPIWPASRNRPDGGHVVRRLAGQKRSLHRCSGKPDYLQAPPIPGHEDWTIARQISQAGGDPSRGPLGYWGPWAEVGIHRT